MNNDKILIIEDDMDIQSANRQLLELEGYRVVTAGTMLSYQRRLRRRRCGGNGGSSGQLQFYG